MTRNRDDFSALQALRVGIVGFTIIALLMLALGTVIANQKDAAQDRATSVAAAALQFEAAPVSVASLDEVVRG